MNELVVYVRERKTGGVCLLWDILFQTLFVICNNVNVLSVCMYDADRCG